MRISFLFIGCLFVQFGFAQSDSSLSSKKLNITEEVYPSKEVSEEMNFSKKEMMPSATHNNMGGVLTETKDERIDLLIQDYMDNKKTMGYRVQLFAGSSKWEAVKTKSDFRKRFDNKITPHVIYQSPNFKVRVGDFRDRLEAQKHLELYKVDYPSAFVVKDEIEIMIPE